MAKYKCEVCEFIYDEEKEGIAWNDLPADWVCPVCGTAKKYFSCVDNMPPEEKPPKPPQEEEEGLEIPIDLKKTTALIEDDFTDIQEMAETGKSVYEPMRTNKPTISWISAKSSSVAAVVFLSI